jgi:hypothetical protein
MPKWLSPRFPVPRCNYADVSTLHAYPVQDRGLTPDIDQAARKQYRIASCLTKMPNAGAKIADPIPAIDIHGQPQLRPKPFLIKFKRGKIIRLHRDLAALRAMAKASTFPIAPDLTAMKLAVGA